MMEKNPIQPGITRFIVILSVLGLITASHLWIMESRNFDRGCVGVALPGQIEDYFDCKGVSEAQVTFFGIPNVVMGVLFYLGLITLSVSLYYLSKPLSNWVYLARSGMLIGAIGYTVYLVYLQYVVLDMYCALCMTNAVIVTTLFLTQLFSFFKYLRTTGSDPHPAAFEWRFFSGVVVTGLILIGMDVLVFQQLEATENSAPESSSPTAAATVPEPADNHQEKPSGSRPAVSEHSSGECYYKDDMAPVENYMALIGTRDPILGDTNSNVTVFDFFDPNCTHCRRTHEMMKEVVAEHGSYVRFVYKPFPLWNYSVNQVQALIAAKNENKFFEMLDLQFERTKPGKGLSLDQIEQIAVDIGIDGPRLISEIRSNKYIGLVKAQRNQARSIGIKSAPTVMVNGKFIASKSRTKDCLSQFIIDEL